MDLLKHYISTCCISFTFSCLFYILFSLLNIFPPMNEALIIHMLFISISIIFLIFITHQLPIQNSLIFRLIELLDVMIVLLVAGAVFKMFPFTWDATLAVITTGILTYIVVIVVIFMGNQKSATEINAVIARKKGGSTID
jgi:peptidoglycan/LPS O-acetylase OafA/YrhL